MGTQPTHELACQPLVSEIVLVHCFALETQQEVAFLQLASSSTSCSAVSSGSSPISRR